MCKPKQFLDHIPSFGVFHFCMVFSYLNISLIQTPLSPKVFGPLLLVIVRFVLNG